MQASITKVESSNCWTNYRVEVNMFSEIVHAWAIVGGTLALTLKDDYMFSKRYNHCPERNSDNPEYANWKAWDGVRVDMFDGGEDTFYNYVLKAVTQREVQQERARLLGPGRRSPRFHDTDYSDYFWCDWGWDGIKGHYLLSPRRSSHVSRVHIQTSDYSNCGYWSMPFANDDWRTAYDLLSDVPYRLKALYELDEQDFEQYREIIEPLRKYKAMTK